MVEYPSGFIGPLKPGDTRADPKVTVKDPKTGREWGSVEEYVKDPKKYGGGSSGSKRSFQEEFKKLQARQAEEKRQAEIKRIADEKARQEAIQKEIARKEQLRIEELRRVLIRQNAQKTVRDYIDSKTKEKVRHETLINRRTGERIWTTTNLATGQIQTKTYGVPRGGGSVRQTGGLSWQGNTLADIQKIQSQLPTGEKLIYDSNYNIKGISSAKLGQTIPYTEKGIDYYNAQLSKIVPKFDFKEYAREIKAQEDLTKQTTIPSDISRNIKIVKDVLLDKINPSYRILFTRIKPTALDNKNLAKFLYSNKFNKKLESLSKTFFINVNNVAQNINYKISELKREKDTAKRKEISKELTTLKERLIVNLYKASVIPSNFTQRQVTMFALGLSARIFMFVGAVPKMVVAVPGLVTAVPGLVSAGVKGTPIFLKKLITDPKAVAKSGYTISKKLATVIKTQVGIFGRLLMVEPGLAIGYITGEYFVLRGIGKGFKIVGKVTKPVGQEIMKLSPKTFEFVEGKIVLRNAPSEVFTVRGKQVLLEKRVLQPSFIRPFSSVADFLKGRKPGQFKKFTKDPGLILKKQTVATGTMPLSEQIKLAGTEVTAVTAQRNQLTTWLRRKQIIRKPIPGEETFPIKIKNSLNKFDSGKTLTTREFADINLWLQKNVAPNITLLERSLYLDPASGVRISRFGITAGKDASLIDIIRGNFRLRGDKPQMLVFEKLRVANLPTSLKNIERKFFAGEKLTVAETNKYIRWQVEHGGGKAKPIGSTIYSGGTELEITLAPGEMIKRIKQIGRIYIDGKKVTIVSAKVYKPTTKLLAQMKKANLGKLSKVQLTSLEKTLSNKLGRKVKVETPTTRKISARDLRRYDSNIPVLRIRGRGIFVVRGFRDVGRVGGARVTPARRTISRKPIGRKVISRKPIGRKVVGRKVISRKPIGRKPIGRKVVGRKVISRKPIGRPPIKPDMKPPVILKLPKDFTQRKLSKPQPVFYVVTRKRGKMVKLYAKPLVLKDARDYLAWSVDHNLTRSAWLVPLGKAKNVVRPPKDLSGYFSKVSRKLKPYKIRYGKKKQLLNGYIEKRKYFQDTKQERSQLARARMKAKRKITPAQRKILIERLKKARMIKMKNIRRR